MPRLLAWLRCHGGALVLLAAAAGIYGQTLSSFGMFMWDEAEYATIGRSLLRGEGFAINGRASLLRPPLLPLAGAASMWLCGAEDDHTVKLATVALTLIALAVVYAVTSAALDRVTGLFAAFLLATAPELWTLTAHFLSETPFLGFFAAAVLGFELGLRRDQRWFWFAWLGWALAMSTRYTAVLFAPYVILRLLAAAVVRREEEWRHIRTASFALAPIAAALLVGPWLLRQHLVSGDALLGFRVASQQLQSYMPGVSMPWSFYLTSLPAMLSPATTILLVAGVAWALWRRDGFTLTCALVLAGLLGWFSAYRYKEVRLATSILPFAAIVAAAGISQMLRGRHRLLLVVAAAAIFVWNRSLVQPVFANWLAAGYPPFLEAMDFVRQHSGRDAVLMGASTPQMAWYADRRVVDFPAAEAFPDALESCDWVLFSNFERGQRAYAAEWARYLLTAKAPDDVVTYRDHRYIAVVAKARFVRDAAVP